MNTDERIAYDFLSTLGFAHVRYEPDGNVPPDFILDDSIAVEVRRLNKHFFSHKDGTVQPLEVLDFKLRDFIQSLMDSYNHLQLAQSAVVSYHFNRPFKFSAKLGKMIREAFDQFLASWSENFDSMNFVINDHLSLSFKKVATRYSKLFLLTSTDGDSSGLVVNDLYLNIIRCIHDKEQKVSSFHKLYKTWWLVLIDRISWGPKPYDMELLNELNINSKLFGRIILLSPTDQNYFSELRLVKKS